MSTSDFGKGLTYNLGLFLAHEERIKDCLTGEKSIESAMKEKYPDWDIEEHASEMWFNAAGDHLFELEIPENYPDDLKKRLKIFQNKVLSWRCVFGKAKHPVLKDVEWSLKEAKELLRLIDNQIGVKTIKAKWS